MTTLTRSQRANLRKLADYLESLPEDYRHFDMHDYMGNDASAAALEYARKNGGVEQCGTVACAVGHGPAAGILFRPSDFTRNWDGTPALSWGSYSRRFTPRGYDEPEFDWAFGSYWRSLDNHHWGAAARIRYLLKHGKPGHNSGDYREFDKRHAKVPA